MVWKLLCTSKHYYFMSLGTPVFNSFVCREEGKNKLQYTLSSPLPKHQPESPLTRWSVLAAIKVKWPLGPEQSHLYLQHLQIKQRLLILTVPSVAKIPFPKEQVEKWWRIVTEHFPLRRGRSLGQERRVSTNWLSLSSRVAAAFFQLHDLKQVVVGCWISVTLSTRWWGRTMLGHPF